MRLVRLYCLAASLICGAPAAAAPACSAGIPLLTFQLAAQPAEDGKVPISVRKINRLEEGQKLIFAPVGFRSGYSDEGEKGKLSLVLVPAGPDHEIVVLDPHKSRATAEWEVPFRTSVVALVYGPTGLSTKKVRALVKKDQELIEQLADYAEQTAQTEKLLEALAVWEDTSNNVENLNAALRGFSSSYGRPVPQLKRNASPDEQMSTMIRALNPALAQYDPLATAPRKRMQQSAMLASSVAGMFFGTPVGLAAGGAAMAVNLGDMMFPDTNFRSAFVQPAPGHSLTLCSKRQKEQSRTRYAYLWAVRVPDVEAPKASLDEPVHVPAGAEAEVKLRLARKPDWTVLGRATNWRLMNETESIPVKVIPLAEKEAVRIRPGDRQAPPGTYRLTANWDWEEFRIDGELHVHEIPEAGELRFADESLDLLVEGGGPVTLKLEGCDFQFVKGVSIRRKGESTELAAPAFELPIGPGKGPQQTISLKVDTTELAAGDYWLSMTMPGEIRRETEFRVLPQHPKLKGLPLRVNLGERRQAVSLTGSGLERIRSIRSGRAEFTMNGHGELHVTLAPDVRKGDRLDVELEVEGLRGPLPVEGMLEVAGPRPRISGSRLSLPGNLDVEIRSGELPAGSFASFSLQVESSLDSPPTMDLACAQPGLTLEARQAMVGEQSPELRLRSAGAGALFLSFDPGAIGQPGCDLQVIASTAEQGRSDAYTLGRVVRLPKISKFELTSEAAGPDRFYAAIEGEDLELIERVGWDEYGPGLLVDALPVPVAAGGHRQTLRVAMPWPAPAPHAPLYVWLRGEDRGRETTARY